MTGKSANQGDEAYPDPRSEKGFQPEYYPKANAQPAPPQDATGKNETITLQFLAVYYHLNQAYAKLQDIRREADTPDRAQAERRQLQALEKVTRIRDELEDFYAPLGVMADPKVVQGVVCNLEMSFGNKDASGRARSDVRSLSFFVPIALPDGVKRVE